MIRVRWVYLSALQVQGVNDSHSESLTNKTPRTDSEGHDPPVIEPTGTWGGPDSISDSNQVNPQ